MVWLQFTPQRGNEQAGPRPALVISPKANNGKVGLALFCPITAQIKGYPFEVKLEPEGKTRGVILSDQLKSLDWRARQANKFDTVSEEVMLEVLGKTGALVAWD